MTVSLNETVKAEVTPLQQERILEIDNEDFTGVVRKVKEEFEKEGREVSDEYLQEGILALKQYYAVALLDPNNMHAVSDTVDPFWHAHIIHTKQYHAFCERVFGEYIHHEPLNHGIDSDVKFVNRLYQYTHAIYDSLFNYFNQEFFPEVLPEVRLICFHYRVQQDDLASVGLFSTDPKMQMNQRNTFA